MKFRKLLAFVLVFSMATQPGGVRFGYAEDTKAAEVENKTEASDELGLDLDEAELDEYLFDPGSREQTLEEAASVAAEEAAERSTFSGALAGAIAAGVAAVSAAVGTLGWMIYNAALNKGAIADVWTSGEGTFFSRVGKTISILFKGAPCRFGESEDGSRCLSNIEISTCKFGEDEENHHCLVKESMNEIASLEGYKQALQAAKQDGQEKLNVLETEIGKAEGKGGEALTAANNLKTVLTDSLNGTDAKAITDAASKVDEVVNALNDAVAAENNAEEKERQEEEEKKPKAEEERKKKEQEEQKRKEAERKQKEEAERKAKEEAERKAPELNSKKVELGGKVTSVQSRIDALKEEHKGTLQDELDTVKATIENATSVEALEGKVTEAEVAQNEAERKAQKLDGEINELILDFGKYRDNYVEQKQNEYNKKLKELKKEHDASKIIKELEAYKQNVGDQLNKLKTCCENRPEKCGK